MDDWPGPNPVEWDAPTKETEGAEYVWESMLEPEPYEPKDPGTVTMLIDLP